MGVDALHPLYQEFQDDWQQMRDTYRGQRIVKYRASVYLPPTSGMVQDGLNTENADGTQAYLAYKERAVFPDIVRAAVESMLGVMHAKPPVIELPDKMEELRDSATLKGESLEMLLRRINEEQLITGRLGLLVEIPPGLGATMPYIAFYRGDDVINWDEGSRTGIELENLNFVSLNETEYERTAGDFQWEQRRKYRVLILGDPMVNEPQGQGTYRVGVFVEESSPSSDQPGVTTGFEFSEDDLVEPSIAGRKTDEIPFVFINSKDITSDPDDPPLLGLSNISLTIYRGEADYRQALFMQGQDTLVVIGAVNDGTTNPEHRVGSGASIDLPMGGDAKFVGVDSAGLPEMRTAIENDHSRAGKKAGEFIDETSRSKESGEALKVRVAARTATLNQLALAGAFGLQELLRKMARWMGANPEEVVVIPNTDFIDDTMSGQELGQLLGAKVMGAPLALQTIHELMQDRNLTEKTWDEELEALEEEQEIELLHMSSGSSDEDGPEDDDDDSTSSGDDDDDDDDDNDDGGGSPDGQG